MNEPVALRLGREPALLQRALAQFEDLLDQPTAARTARLEELASRDPEVAEAVAWLLAQDDAGTFLDRSAPDPWLGRNVGAADRRVRLLERLGEGGTSRVYLGEDAGGVRVAVKLLPSSAEAADVAERFERERRILAGLDHPGIARLLAAGVEDGRPYLVMELVEGSPISEHCDRRRLPIAERLALFSVVCEAVEALHHQLLAHRDLKPANVLVGADGRPKLLDFGLAKLLAGSEEVTAPERRLLTPAYASPEQLAGGRVTVATDVYSLGVILFELSTGLRPVEAVGRFPAEVVAELAAREPAAASEAVLGAPRERAEAVAERRGTTVPKLAAALAGDLDAILRRALAFEPAGRYPSVAALREDVERHLAGRPVAAHRSSRLHRARKLLRRHALAAAAAGLAAAVGVAMLAAFLADAARARRERDRYREVVAFLTSSVRQLGPEASRSDPVTAKALIDQAVARLDAEGVEEPETKAAILHAAGTVYSGLGQYAEALSTLERALELRRATFGDASLTVAETRCELAAVLLEHGRLREADEAARRSLDDRLRRLPADDPAVGESFHVVAMTALRSGRFEEAETHARRALAIRRREGATAAEVDDLALIASSLAGRGDFAAADGTAREALARAEAVFGERHLQAVAALDALVGILIQGGRAADALPLAERLLDLRRDLLGERHPAVAKAASQLGTVLFQIGAFEPAEERFRFALEVTESALGDDHPDLATIRQNLALVLGARGRRAEAEELTRGAIAIYRQGSAGHRQALATSLNNLAVLRAEVGARDEAIALYGEALDVFRALHGGPHPDLAMVLNNQAVLIQRQGRPAEAAERFAEAATILRETAGDPSVFLAILDNNLAVAAREQGSFVEAEELHRRAIAEHRRHDPGAVGSPRLAQALADLGVTLWAAGRRDEAEPPLQEALAIRRQTLGEDHPATVETRLDLARLALDRGAREAARDAATAALARLGSRPATSAVSAKAHALLAAVELVAGRPTAARSQARDAERLYLETLGESHVTVVAIRALLAAPGA